MGRLTNPYWKNDDPWELCGLDNDCKRRCVANGDWCKVAIKLRRLAAYEDTGLTPEECAAYSVAENEKRVIVFESAEIAEDIRAELKKCCEYCRGWDNRCGTNYCPMCGRKL